MEFIFYLLNTFLDMHQFILHNLNTETKRWFKIKRKGIASFVDRLFTPMLNVLFRLSQHDLTVLLIGFKLLNVDVYPQNAATVVILLKQTSDSKKVDLIT